MKKDNLWVIASGLIFVGGIGSLFFVWNYGWDNPNNIELPSNLPIAKELPVDPNFNPRPNDRLSFEATAIITPNNESPLTTRVQYDGRGTARFEATQDGGSTEFFLTPTNRILCDEVDCYRLDIDPNDRDFSVDEYVFGQKDLSQLGQGLVLSSEETCGDSICEVWTSPSPVDVDPPRVLLDKTTKNIITITDKQDEGLIEINYVYKDVKIILPLNIVDPDSES